MAENFLTVKREGEFRYPIYFEESFEGLAEALKKEGLGGTTLCIVTDTHVAEHYLFAVKAELEKAAEQVHVFVFEAGEARKNLDTITELYEFLIEKGMDRKGLLAALGGGVVGDLAGFAAATYLRGIDFIQIPTTLLAQVDSSVGGKTGVDLNRYKNMVGAFHQPRLVYMNLETLRTLPEAEFSCGMGEVLKTGLICDAVFFDFVCKNAASIKNFDMEFLARMVRRCCEIKAEIVERDPTEQGDRALLNLGHTVGHAVEKLKDFQLLHGQCVGLGLLAAARLSVNRGLLSEAAFSMIREGCRAYDLPLSVVGLKSGDILLATKKDKKMEHGHIKFVLMEGLGKTFVDRTVSDEELLTCIQEIVHE